MKSIYVYIAMVTVVTFCLLAMIFLGPQSVYWLAITSALSIAACLIFFILTTDMIAACRHKHLNSSPGIIMIQLFLLGSIMSALFIIIFALIYKIDDAINGKMIGEYIYNSAQYFYNTGATTNRFAGEMKYLQLSESMIGYSFYPAYIGTILYLFSTKSSLQERAKNPGTIKRIYYWIIDC
jgi:hypothetical protein